MRKTFRSIFAALAFGVFSSVHAAGQLVVEQAWIRSAPPGSAMLAGYAVLRNVGDEALGVNAVSSTAFASASLHETREENGVAKMRALPSLLIAPGAEVELAPGGKHLMLMQPKAATDIGKSVTIEFVLGDKSRVSTEFVVREDAPAGDDAH